MNPMLLMLLAMGGGSMAKMLPLLLLSGGLGGLTATEGSGMSNILLPLMLMGGGGGLSKMLPIMGLTGMIDPQTALMGAAIGGGQRKSYRRRRNSRYNSSNKLAYLSGVVSALKGK